jgi:cytidine deaminase
MTDRELINAAFKAMENAYARIRVFVSAPRWNVKTESSLRAVMLKTRLSVTRLCRKSRAGKGDKRGATEMLCGSQSRLTATDTACCGSCRQVIGEFAEDAEILSARFDGRYVTTSCPSFFLISFKMK